MGQHDDAELSSRDAKRRKRSTRSKGRQDWGYTFVNLSLTRQDKDAIRNMPEDVERMFEYLWAKVEDGHKFSLTYAQDDGAYIATLSGKEASCPNHKLIMTGRGSTPLKALSVLMYKTETLMGGLSWAEPEDDGDLLG